MPSPSLPPPKPHPTMLRSPGWRGVVLGVVVVVVVVVARRPETIEGQPNGERR